MDIPNSINRRNLYAVIPASKGKRIQLTFLRLNEYDNDPHQFWKTFLGMLTSWNMQFTQNEVQKPCPISTPKIRLFLEGFEKNLKKKPLLMIIDNLQQITDPEVHEFLDTLMQSSGLFVMLLYDEEKMTNATNDTHFNILEGKKKYMSQEEELAYYNNKLLQCTEEEFKKIHYFTDGWKSAVYVIAQILSTRGRRNVDNLEMNFSFWIENVFLAQYTEPEMQLVVCLSLLKDFSLELIRCLSNNRGEVVKEFVEASPIIRYKQETRSYFYSDFFKNYLKEKKILLTNKKKKEFYTRVADWYKERGENVEAITYYRKAGANKKILQIMQQWVFPSTREVAKCYIETINDMPAAFLNKQPFLHVVRGYMLTTLYHYEDVYTLMKKFCSQYDQGDDTDPKVAPIVGEAYILLANASACLQYINDETVQMYKKAAEYLPNGSTMLRGKINVYADRSVIQLPSPEAGSMQSFLDHLCKAEPYISKATGGGWTGCSHLAAAEMNYYTRNFKEVEKNAYQAIAFALEKEQYDVVCSAYSLLSRYSLAKGNYDKTMENYYLLKEYALEANYDTFFSMPDLAESWLMLKMGRKHKVADWIRDESRFQTKVVPWNYGRDRVIHCEYLLLNHQFEEVMVHVETNIALLKKRGSNLLILHLLVIKAAVSYELAQWEKLVDAFEEIYQWTHQNSIIMPIVEYGSYVPLIIDKYRKFSNGNIPDEWLAEIEKKAKSYYVYQYNIRKQYEREKVLGSTLLEKLTGAEQKLLLSISKGMTFKEIADLNGKTVNAVKSMSRRVYIKIGAKCKSDAIRIAAECNIEKSVRP